MEELNEKKIKEIELIIDKMDGERGDAPFISSPLSHTIG
jgi:hypothetical protein